MNHHIYEWASITTVKYAAGTNTPLLTKLTRNIPYCSPHSDGRVGATRFDTLVVFAFFEFLFQIRYLAFSPASGVLVPSNNMCLFKDLIEQDGATVVNPISLSVLIDIDDHVDMTVMSLNLGD